MSKVYVFDHPLIQHKTAMIRKEETSVKDFRELVKEIAMLMGYEATRQLPLEEVEGGDERLLAILAPFVYDTGGDVIDAERTLPYDASLVARVTGRWLLLTRRLSLRNGLGSSDLGNSLSMISWFNE